MKICSSAENGVSWRMSMSSMAAKAIIISINGIMAFNVGVIIK
jgi:hypothetical protein